MPASGVPMSEPASRLLWLRDPRLAPLAVSGLPAWLWSADAGHVLWANPTGAAVFGAPNAAALAERRFDAGQPAAAQIARLAATLPPDGAGRLERLRGFGAGIGRAVTCHCTQVTLAGGDRAVLIAATERAGPDLPLEQRVHRLLAGIAEPVAALSAAGVLIDATAAARAWLGGAATLAALDAEALAAEAIRSGHAQGASANGSIVLDRIGTGPEAILIATFAPPLALEPPRPEADASAAAAVTAAEDTEIAKPDQAAPPTPAPPYEDPEPAQPVTVDSEAATLSPSSSETTSPPERRHPLRFVWQIDPDGRFKIDCDEFVALAGPRTATMLGRPWDEIAATLGLDPDGQVARAIASHDTWSGLSVSWPVTQSHERLAVELSGLPVFDRERSFRGYRGFGVCRDLARLNALAQARHDAPAAAALVEPAVPPSPDGDDAGATAEHPAENVVPFRAISAEPSVPTLTPVERRAFRDLARRLTERLTAPGDKDANGAEAHDASQSADPTLSDLADAAKAAAASPPDPATRTADIEHDLFAPSEPETAAAVPDVRPILDRFPVGVLVYRLNALIYANRTFLRWTGYDSIEELAEAGGLDSLFVESGAIAIEDGGHKSFAVTSNRGERIPAEGRLFLVPWEGDSAFALLTTPVVAGTEDVAGAALKATRAEVAELRAILDTATDGVILLDGETRILSSNRSAQALFGYDDEALAGQSFMDLFAPESIDVALDYLDGLARDGVASVLNDGREVIGRERQGGLIPLFMTIGRVDNAADKYCAVFRDITQWKKAEEELIEAKRQAEKASSAKSDLLAKISHEIRTPLNAIIGFSEVMMEERFGPVGNDRYRQYLKDIHGSGGHLISLINDLLDLSKIEAGKFDLDPVEFDLRETVDDTLQTLALRAHTKGLELVGDVRPGIPAALVGDPVRVRQVLVNLIGNAIKFTHAGQVVVRVTEEER
ncbi:MAG: hypothetical protein QOI12_57, partial [Alphaproteobacteria bacterium]|nr:hypothetical protein [Alphaproteobacteria bacterium]